MTPGPPDVPPEFDALCGEVSAVLRRAAVEELLPRFAALESLDVREKAPGDLVTDADLACERRVLAELGRLLPSALQVGEECAHRDPRLLDALPAADWAWVLDPLDGTRPFSRGDPSFGVQLALFARGAPMAAWIYLPVEETLAHARRGEGCFVDGRPHVGGASRDVAALRGAVLTRYLPHPLRDEVEKRARALHVGLPYSCAAAQYVDLLRGDRDFALYYRTLPWDHAPGALLLHEAGGAARRLDGGAYAPADGGAGLLVTREAGHWTALRDRICPSQGEFGRRQAGEGP